MTTITLPVPGAKAKVLGPERATFGWIAKVYYPWTLETAHGLSDGVVVRGLTQASCQQRVDEALARFYERVAA